MFYEGDFGNVDAPVGNEIKKPRSSLFLTLFAVIFFTVLVIFFISYSLNSNNVSHRDLVKGDSFDLKDNESLKVRFERERHKVNISILGANHVEITVASEPITKLIGINESVFFDLDNDSKNDLRVWLLSIENYKAEIEFKRIDGGFCSPDWECVKWGPCIDGLRKRTCEDLKRCGKPEDSPEIQKFCADVLEGDDDSQKDAVDKLEGKENVSTSNDSQDPDDPYNFNLTFDFQEKGLFIGDGELSCSENNGNNCAGGQKCDGTWINSSNSLRCCFGDCYFLDFNLTGSNSSVVCDQSLSSFRFAVSNCTPFKMDCVENVLIFELNILHGFESVLEIQGYLPGNKCSFYYGYENVFINYTAEKYLSLLSEGKSVPQINFELSTLETEHIQKYQDKNMVCEYPQNEFLDFARDWEEGKIEWNRDILGKYECTGSLSEI
jgi:hypothetical protein